MSELARLVDDLDREETDYLQATIWETQRVRPVIGGVARQISAPSMELGEWVIPHGTRVIVALGIMHQDPAIYPDPQRFDPDRFVGRKPDFTSWLPFGGGNRRCIGAEFANMEMKVVLRCLLRDFELLPTDAPDEEWHDRGVAFAPSRGGRIAVRRRSSGTAVQR